MSKDYKGNGQYSQKTPYVRYNRYDQSMPMSSDIGQKPEETHRKKVVRKKPVTTDNPFVNPATDPNDGRQHFVSSSAKSDEKLRERKQAEELARQEQKRIEEERKEAERKEALKRKKAAKRKSAAGAAYINGDDIDFARYPDAQPTRRKVVKRTVVRKSAPSPAKASKEQLSAMDKHFADIEKALGLTSGQAVNVVNGIDSKKAEEDLILAKAAKDGKPVAPDSKPGSANKTPAGAKNQPKKPNQKMDAQTKKAVEYLVLGVEVIAFVVVVCIMISLSSKIKKKDFKVSDASVETKTEASVDEEAEQSGEGSEGDLLGDEAAGDILDSTESTPAASNSVDVDNDSFTLNCTNVNISLDMEGNPAALIYFTFTNKTSTPLSMSEVFPPSVTQNGEFCETFASMEQYPEEFYNKDTQISDGNSIQCCFVVALKDAVSPIVLTIHDNYETFADVGTVEIAIQ